MQGRRERIHLAIGQSFRLLRWNDNLQDVDSLLPMGGVARVAGEGNHWHYHPEMELTQFAAGHGTLFVGDYIAPFAAGESVLLGQRLPHHWNVQGVSSGLSLQWHFPEEHPFWSFPESLTLAPLFQAASRGIGFRGQAAADIRQTMRRMAEVGAVERLGLLLSLLGRLASVSGKDRTFLSARSFSLPARARHQEAMRQAVRYILANFRESIRLPDVLGHVRASKPTFAREFRKHSGKTFSEFLTHVRLQAACRELEHSDRPVLDIALDCGFSHVSFFNRAFQRILRCTPTCYRVSSRRS